MVMCALTIEMLFDDQDEYNEDNEEDIEDLLVVFQVMLLRHRRLIYEEPHIPRRLRINIPRS